MKKILLLVLLLIVLVGFSALGFHLGREYQKIYQPPHDVDFSLFWQVWALLRERFPDIEKIEAQELIQGAISGMLEALKDPHTRFFTPEETRRFIEGMKGEFEGIGIQIGIKENQLQVIAPIKETPAYKAGLRSRDKILKIDGVSTVNMAIQEAVIRIRGPRGTEVVLTILREGWEEKREIKIIRETIIVPSLSWELIEENIAHVRIYHFIERSGIDFMRVANEILASPAEKIILDLRNNPGGYLNVAKDITGWFLERGQIVVIKDFDEEREQRIYRTDGPSRLLGYPIVVLINRGSASGAEILAGALRDNREVKIIGEISAGKGSVQEFVRLREDASLKITVANWLTPEGKLITNQGLEPDIFVERTEEDIKQERDPQLDKAIKVIKKNESNSSPKH